MAGFEKILVLIVLPSVITGETTNENQIRTTEAISRKMKDDTSTTRLQDAEFEPPQCSEQDWVQEFIFLDDINTFIYSRTCEIGRIQSNLTLALESVNGDSSGSWDSQCYAKITADDKNSGDCTFGLFGGVKSIINTFTTSNSLKWSNVVFLQDGTVEIGNNDVDVERTSVKFAFATTNWEYTELLSVCIEVGASAVYGFYGDLEPARQRRIRDKLSRCIIGENFEMGEYRFNNELMAECTGDDDIYVNETMVVHHLEFNDIGGKGIADLSFSICYEFDYCEGGSIIYDPFVYYEGTIFVHDVHLLTLHIFPSVMDTYTGEDADSGFGEMANKCSVLMVIFILIILA